MILDERELTEPVELVRPDGRLNRAAVGWTRTPLHDTSGVGARTGWGRTKRWEYWAVVGPEWILALTVASIDYAAVSEAWVFQRSTGQSWGRSGFRPFGAGVVLPPTLGDGPASARSRGLSIDVVDREGGTTLRASLGDVRFEVDAVLPPGHERLGVVVPWSDRTYQYTVKDVARPASGWVEIAGVRHALDASDTWAVLDHGRGRWPYDVAWNWAAASGRSDGHVIGLQLGSKWTHGTGATENAFVVDGRLHKNSEELVWDYDVRSPLEPWHIHGETADLRFEPFHDKQSSTQLGILSTRTDQCFGTFSGWICGIDGARAEFTALTGWAEDVHNRW